MTTELVPIETHGVVKIGFKSGREVQFLATKCTIDRKAISGQLIGIKWEDTFSPPMYFDLQQIDYVMFDNGPDSEEEQVEA